MTEIDDIVAVVNTPYGLRILKRPTGELLPITAAH